MVAAASIVFNVDRGQQQRLVKLFAAAYNAVHDGSTFSTCRPVTMATTKTMARAIIHELILVYLSSLNDSRLH